MNIRKRSLGVALLSVLCAVCMLFGVSYADKGANVETVNAETVMTVEDLYDVTSRANDAKVAYDGISNWITFCGYESAVAENYEFTSRIVLTFESNKEFVFGIMANGNNGGQGSYDGYWFVMNEVADVSDTSGRTMKLFTKKQFFNNQDLTKTNENGALDALWGQMLAKDGFNFAMGVQSKTDQGGAPYTYVYVKVNGSVVFEYDNYNSDNVTYGKYIYADSSMRAALYANKDLEKSEATVEDVYDVTDGEVVYAGMQYNGGFPIGTSSVNKNFEFNANVVYAPMQDNWVDMPIGILGDKTDTAGNGYWLRLNREGKGSNTLELYSGMADPTRNIVKTVVAPQAVYAKNGFDLRFGAVEMLRNGVKVCNYVYAYINGELIFEYNDYQERTLGNYVSADAYGRVNFYATKDLVRSEATVEDVYDVTDGEVVYAGMQYNGGFPIGTSSVNKNFEFNANVVYAPMNDNWADMPIGILGNAQDTAGNGYWLRLNRAGKGSNTLELYFGTANNVGNIVAMAVAPQAVYTKNGFNLRFGAVEMLRNGVKVCNYVYAYINGVLVLDGNDYEERTLGSYVSADAYGRVNFYATKDLVKSEATVEDVYDVTDGEVVYAGMQYNGGFPIGTSSVNKNFEFNANVVYAPMNDNWADMPIGILGDKTDTAGNGYWLRLNRAGKGSNTLELYFGTANNADNIVATAVAPQAVYAESGFDLRFGAVEMLRGGEKVCNYVYAYINGVLVLDGNDYEERTLGNYVAADAYGRANFYIPNTDAVGMKMLGASIKISNTGIRFMSEIDTATYDALVEKYGEENVTLGTVVLPTVLLQGGELTLETAQIQNSVNEIWYAESDDGKVWTCVVKNIPEGAYDIEISARSYLQVRIGENTYTFYGETVARSIEDVAQAALDDYVLSTDENYDETLYRHEYVVDGVTYYHRFSETERIQLQKFTEVVEQ